MPPPLLVLNDPVPCGSVPHAAVTSAAVKAAMPISALLGLFEFI
jgi:hypothetical protein